MVCELASCLISFIISFSLVSVTFTLNVISSWGSIFGSPVKFKPLPKDHLFRFQGFEFEICMVMYIFAILTLFILYVQLQLLLTKAIHFFWQITFKKYYVVIVKRNSNFLVKLYQKYYSLVILNYYVGIFHRTYITGDWSKCDQHFILYSFNKHLYQYSMVKIISQKLYELLHTLIKSK